MRVRLPLVVGLAVLAACGDIASYDPRNGSPARSALLLFDPSTNTWQKATDPPKDISGVAGSVVVDTTIVYDSFETPGGTLTYNAKTGKWRRRSECPQVTQTGCAKAVGKATEHHQFGWVADLVG